MTKTLHIPFSVPVGFSNLVQKKISDFLKTYTYIDQSIIKKYFSKEQLLFTSFVWCLIPTPKSTKTSSFRLIIEALAVIEMFIKSSILHLSVNNDTTNITKPSDIKSDSHKKLSEQQWLLYPLVDSTKNPQIILFGDMLIAACANEINRLPNPIFKKHLNQYAYKISINQIKDEIFLTRRQKKYLTSNFQFNLIQICLNWIPLIPLLTTNNILASGALSKHDYARTRKIHNLIKNIYRISKHTSSEPPHEHIKKRVDSDNVSKNKLSSLSKYFPNDISPIKIKTLNLLLHTFHLNNQHKT